MLGEVFGFIEMYFSEEKFLLETFSIMHAREWVKVSSEASCRERERERETFLRATFDDDCCQCHFFSRLFSIFSHKLFLCCSPDTLRVTNLPTNIKACDVEFFNYWCMLEMSEIPSKKKFLHLSKQKLTYQTLVTFNLICVILSSHTP